MTPPAWLNMLLPGPDTLGFQEKLRVGLGAMMGIALTAIWAGFAQSYLHVPWWMFAPLGASAAQVFSVPGSPLSQPWNVILGHLISAISAMLSLALLGQSALSAGLAVGLAVFAMLMCRCLHASGGGTALLVLLAGISDPTFLLFPLTATSVSLVILAAFWFRLQGRTYPQAQQPDSRSPASGLIRYQSRDLEAALGSHHQALAMSREDIEQLMNLTELHALKRITKGMACADIMTTPVRTAHFGSHIKDVWALFNAHDIKAVPVVDRKHRVHGIITPEIVMTEADEHGGLKALLTPNGLSHSEIPEAAVQIMSEEFVTAHVRDPLEGLLPLFSKGDRRHVLVLDDERKLVGIISTSDIMQAMYHAAA